MTNVDRRHFLKTTGALGLTPLSSPKMNSTMSIKRNPLGIRDDFAVTQNQTYLNTSYVGPFPAVVHEAAIKYANEQQLTPAKGLDISMEIKEATRVKFAELFGATRDEVALLFSTSDAENIVTSAINLKAGDNVVIDELHFVTSFVLYRWLEQAKGIELRIVPHTNGRSRIQDFESRTDARTRLISVAWVSNRNGYRHSLPALAELVHANGGYLFADGIQALGTFPTNLRETGADFVCANSYKYLLASWGAAPFFVREEHLDRITPDRFGHNQVSRSLPNYNFELKTSAEKYEYAGLIYGAVAQLNAALGYIDQVGLSRIEAHTVALAQALRNGIAKLGYSMFTPANNPSCITSFDHGLDPEHIRRVLDEEKISVSFRERETQIRASVGMFNNQDDIDHFLQILSRLA